MTLVFFKKTFVLLTLFLSWLFVSVSILLAASAGPQSPQTLADDATVGTETWSNPSNAASSNDSYATVTVDGTISHYLKATNFGFSIPTTATIRGIQVSIERKSNKTTAGGSKDSSLRLVKGGTIVGDDKADTTTTYTTSDVIASYGGASDLWGTTWGPSDINSSNFGVVFAATKPRQQAPAHTISVDSILVTVTHNSSPVAVDDPATTDEDREVVIAAATLLANDTDADGDTLSVTGVGNPINGSVSLAGTNITFTPSANYNGSGATFEYTVSDGELTDTGLVTVTVSAVNDAPAISVTAPNGGNIFAGASSQTIAWSASDVDGDTLTIDLAYTTDGSTFTTIAAGETNDGSFSWTVPSINSTTVKVRATANDGTTTISDLSDANFTIDSTAPTGTITINSGATYTTSTSVTLTFTVSETISTIELRNGTVGSFQNPVAYASPNSYTLPGGDGTKTVSVLFTDLAGNKSTTIIGTTTDDIILDTTSPTGSWSSPSSGATVTGTAGLIVSASDATSGVASVAFSLRLASSTDSFTAIDTDLTSPYTAAWDTTGLTLDTYTLRATITDNAGNSTTLDRNVDVGAVVSSIVSNTTSFTSIVVSWTTDRATTGRVIYDTVSHSILGDVPNYGYAFTTGEFDTNPKATSHNIVIGGLSSGTLYYYRTVSTGSPVTISEEKGVQTFSVPGAGPPPTDTGAAPTVATTTGQVLGAATLSTSIVPTVVFPTTAEVEETPEEVLPAEEIKGVTAPPQPAVEQVEKPKVNLLAALMALFLTIINFILKLLGLIP